MFISNIFRQVAAAPGMVYREWNAPNMDDRKFNRGMIVAMAFASLSPIGAVMTAGVAATDHCSLQSVGGLSPMIIAECPATPQPHQVTARLHKPQQ